MDQDLMSPSSIRCFMCTQNGFYIIIHIHDIVYVYYSYDILQFEAIMFCNHTIQEVVIGDGDGATLPDPSEKFEELLMR